MIQWIVILIGFGVTYVSLRSNFERLDFLEEKTEKLENKNQILEEQMNQKVDLLHKNLTRLRSQLGLAELITQLNEALYPDGIKKSEIEKIYPLLWHLRGEVGRVKSDIADLETANQLKRYSDLSQDEKHSYRQRRFP